MRHLLAKKYCLTDIRLRFARITKKVKSVLGEVIATTPTVTPS